MTIFNLSYAKVILRILSIYVTTCHKINFIHCYSIHLILFWFLIYFDFFFQKRMVSTFFLQRNLGETSLAKLSGQNLNTYKTACKNRKLFVKMKTKRNILLVFASI